MSGEGYGTFNSKGKTICGKREEGRGKIDSLTLIVENTSEVPSETKLESRGNLMPMLMNKASNGSALWTIGLSSLRAYLS